ncbi:MAG: helix-turn-helix domain-containing protein [Methylococcales bacterium]|nr:helix-turn-helix domain-containing protein [Methylococcales bacterium]
MDYNLKKVNTMSFKAITWAFNQSPNKPIQKHLLFILAYRADKNYQCYPSISCLIRDTGMGRRTIQEHLRELLAQELITITERIGSSNIYTLILSNEGEKGDKIKPFFQHHRKKSALPLCETRIQNQSIKTSSLSTEEVKQIMIPVDNLTAEMKAAYNWAKKEPFWSPRIEQINNFIRFYTTGDLKNQYLHTLNKKNKATKPISYSKPSEPEAHPWNQKSKPIDKIENIIHFKNLLKKFGETALTSIPVEYHSQLQGI